ncbi:MAG TPA: cyclic nucleotide-binding domain-containing protein [Cellvibrio sp.]|nr:cyclic nucleotide-binding domain-containing protein [Cellvibrio sp.]
MKITEELLAQYAPFNTLSSECLAKVCAKASLRQFDKGAIIFKRGRELSEAFYLVEGNIDLIDAQFAINSLTSEGDRYPFMLESTSPTQVSALAKSPVTVLVIDRDFLDLVMAWSESGEEESLESGDEGDWMSSLLQSPLFHKIPPSNISQLFIRFQSHKVNADEVIMREGERGDYFYVLQSGSATVLDKQGNLLAALRPGDYFGEEALVGDTTRNAMVKMLTSGTLMRLEKADFITLLQEPVRRFISYEELLAETEGHSRYQIIDVRIPFERRLQAIPNSRNIPLNQLRKTLPQLDANIIYAVADDAGRRTDVAVQLFSQAGFEARILRNASAHYGSGDEPLKQASIPPH